jgi:ribosomal protein L13
MKGIIEPPTVLESDNSPIVSDILSFIEQQGSIIRQQAEEIQKLKDEKITRSTVRAMLCLTLKRSYKKIEVLLVFERSDIPLNNNRSENTLRKHVKK